MHSSLNPSEVKHLRDAPGSIADGGETHPDLWALERRGYLRPVYSFNPDHYKIDDAPRYVFPYIGFNFAEPVYAYTRTEFGETTNAFHVDLEGGASVDI